jgi:hypothetical protein
MFEIDKILLDGWHKVIHIKFVLVVVEVEFEDRDYMTTIVGIDVLD